MTDLQFVDASIWVVLLTTGAVGLAAVLALLTQSESNRDRIWRNLQVVFLMSALAALILPHPQIVSRWVREAGTTSILESSRLGEVLVPWTIAAWVCGSVFKLTQLFLSTLWTWRSMRRCIPLPDADVATMFPHLNWYDREGRSPDGRACLLITSEERGPYCWQFHQPAVVLSYPLLEFPCDERELIVRHELQHLRAGHPLHLFLQRLAEACFWFHPAVWWASWMSVRQREFTCDAACVTSRTERVAYLKGLLRIAESERGRIALAPVGLPFGGCQSLVADRAKRLADDAPGTCASRWKTSVLPRIALFTMFLTFTSAVGGMGWSPWPRWSANVLWDLGVNARDYDPEEHRFRPQELKSE